MKKDGATLWRVSVTGGYVGIFDLGTDSGELAYIRACVEFGRRNIQCVDEATEQEIGFVRSMGGKVPARM